MALEMRATAGTHPRSRAPVSGKGLWNRIWSKLHRLRNRPKDYRLRAQDVPAERIIVSPVLRQSRWCKRGLAQYRMVRYVCVYGAKQQPIGQEREWKLPEEIRQCMWRYFGVIWISLSIMAKKTRSRGPCTANRLICLPIHSGL